MGDKRKGRGEMKFTDGSIYKGQWANDVQEGLGTWMSKDGKSKYDGNWHLGLRYGQGTYTWTDGGSYSGGWVEDKREGKGTMKYPDGFVYEGEWKADRVCCSSKILCFNAPIASWPWHLSEPKWYSQIRRS